MHRTPSGCDCGFHVSHWSCGLLWPLLVMLRLHVAWLSFQGWVPRKHAIPCRRSWAGVTLKFGLSGSVVCASKSTTSLHYLQTLPNRGRAGSCDKAHMLCTAAPVCAHYVRKPEPKTVAHRSGVSSTCAAERVGQGISSLGEGE